MVETVPTAIVGLDAVLGGGGLVGGTMALIEGALGAGKTTRGLQFVQRGVVERGEPGVVITVLHQPAQFDHAALTTGWDLRRLVQDGMLIVISHMSARQG